MNLKERILEIGRYSLASRVATTISADWSRISMVLNALDNNQTVFRSGYEGAVEEEQIGEFLKVVEKLKSELHLVEMIEGNVPKYTRRGTVDSGKTEFTSVFIGDNLLVETNFNGKECTLSVSGLDKAKITKIIDSFSPFLKKKSQRKGRACTLLKGVDGIFVSDLGAGGVAFTPENYTSQVIEDYNFVRQDLASETPRGRLVILDGPPGTGKCLAKGTKILMFDGSVKNVEDIIVGEMLMGPDSKPRKVLSLARGQEEMIRVTPNKGESWICNRSHILSLIDSTTDEIFNLSIDEYQNLPNHRKHHLKLYRTKIEFPTKETLLEPYFAGLWLGDGTRDVSCITTTDFEVKNYLQEYADKLGMRFVVKEQKDNKSELIFIRKSEGLHNIVLDEIRTFVNSDREKRIPASYLLNDRKSRLELLAGLLDSDGHLSTGGFEIITKFNSLKDDILFLARSLGFAAYCTAKYNNEYNKNYWRIYISGNCAEIPTKIKRKQSSIRLQKKDVLRTGFKLESIGIDEYFGFEIDKDRLFVLGDFTVAHNTFFVRGLINEIENSIFLIVPSSLVGHISDPSFMPALIDLHEDEQVPIILVLEDADTALLPRAMDTMSTISDLLNFADGIVGNIIDFRIIATTNAKKMEIEPALLRKGRLSRNIHIGKLPPEKCREIFERINGEQKEYSENITRVLSEPMVLADVYDLAAGFKASSKK